MEYLLNIDPNSYHLWKAMKDKENNTIIEHWIGVYMSRGGKHKRKLSQVLEISDKAQNVYWMRKLTKRGAIDIFHKRLLTNHELNCYEKEFSSIRTTC